MPIIKHTEVADVSSSLSVENAKSGKRLQAEITIIGEDLVIVVGGGERPHLGCVVLAQPSPSKGRPGAWSASCSVLTIPPHKEEPIARGIATRVAEELARVTVVTAGIHDDHLDRAGIDDYLRLGEELAESLVEYLTGDTV